MSVEKDLTHITIQPLSGESEALIRELLQVERLMEDLQIAHDLIKEQLMRAEPRARDWLVNHDQL